MVVVVVVVVVVSFFMVMIVLKGKITYIYNVSSNGSIDISDTSNSTEMKTKFITFLIQEEDYRSFWMIMIYYSKIMGHDTRREDKYL